VEITIEHGQPSKTHPGVYNDYFQVRNPLTRLKSKISLKARKKMYGLFIRMAMPTEESNILDIGVTPETSLPENNYFEKWYPWTHNIVMASVEDASNLTSMFKGAKFVRTMPNEALPFEDDEFDIVFCSAVLEHVGDFRSQAFFIMECLRVGKRVFLTTPNKYFPIEFHTYLPLVHFLPRRVHQAILRTLGMKFFAHTQNLNLVTAAGIKKMLGSSAVPIKSKVLFNKTLGIKSNIILFAERQDHLTSSSTAID